MIQKTFIIFLFYCSFIINAQNHTEASSVLLGNITTENNRPLLNATILIENTSLGTNSKSNGSYKINNIPFGTHTVTASFLGFTSISKTIKIEDNYPLELNFTLTETKENLDEIIIKTLSKTEQKRDKGFVIEAVKTSDLQVQSVTLTTVLNQLAGIKVRQDGGLGSRSNFSINGLSGKSIRFFLDGIPMDYYGSSFSINTIPISLIDKIEVYKGVVPVELGNDALGGAVNLISKKQVENNLQTSYSYGSFNTHRVSVNGNYQHKKTGLFTKFSAFYNYSDNDYKIWGDDIYVTNLETFEIERGIKVKRFNDAFKSKAIKFDAGFKNKKWADSFLIGFVYSNMDKEIQHGSTMTVPYGEASYKQNVISPNFSYKKNNLFIKGLHLNLFSSYTNLVRKRVDTTKNIYNWYGEIDGQRTLGGEQTRTLSTLKQKTFLNRLNAVYHINKHHKIGYNYIVSNLNRTDRDPLITQETSGYYAPQKLQKYSMGLSLQSKFFEKKLNTILFSKWFSYNASIKTSDYKDGDVVYNNDKAKASNLGFGFTSSYAFTPDFKINTSLEKTYRLPEAEEILGDGLTVQSASDLKAESSLNINLGFDLMFFAEENYNLQFLGNLFYRDVTNLIQQQQYDLASFQYVNFDDVLMKGFDVKLKYSFKEVFTFSQTFSKLNPVIKSNTDEFGNDNVTENSRLSNIPFTQANSNFRTNFNDFFQKKSKSFLYWSINYTGEFHKNSEIIGDTNLDKIPEQVNHNFGFGYVFPNEKVSLSFDLNNVFNEQLFDNYAIQKPGRAAYIKMTYTFK